MKRTVFKLAAAAGLALASAVPANAATFGIDMANSSVTVTDYFELGFTTFSADLNNSLSSVTFDLTNPGDSFTFDFIDLDIGGILGTGWVDLAANLAFSPPGGIGSSIGEGFYAKGFLVEGGVLEWSSIPNITANGVTYNVSLSNLSGITVSDPTVTATVTLISEVPEPATWAMMIAGFGLVGGSLRLRRREGQALAA